MDKKDFNRILLITTIIVVSTVLAFYLVIFFYESEEKLLQREFESAFINAVNSDRSTRISEMKVPFSIGTSYFKERPKYSSIISESGETKIPQSELTEKPKDTMNGLLQGVLYWYNPLKVEVLDSTFRAMLLERKVKVQTAIRYHIFTNDTIRWSRKDTAFFTPVLSEPLLLSIAPKFSVQGYVMTSPFVVLSHIRIEFWLVIVGWIVLLFALSGRLFYQQKKNERLQQEKINREMDIQRLGLEIALRKEELLRSKNEKEIREQEMRRLEADLIRAEYAFNESNAEREEQEKTLERLRMEVELQREIVHQKNVEREIYEGEVQKKEIELAVKIERVNHLLQNSTPSENVSSMEYLIFDYLAFDKQTNLLFYHGEVVPMEPRPALILALLIDKRGEFLPNKYFLNLIQKIDGAVISDVTLRKHISELRSAIKNIPEMEIINTTKIGYRLIIHNPSLQS